MPIWFLSIAKGHSPGLRLDRQRGNLDRSGFVRTKIIPPAGREMATYVYFFPFNHQITIGNRLGRHWTIHSGLEIGNNTLSLIGDQKILSIRRRRATIRLNWKEELNQAQIDMGVNKTEEVILRKEQPRNIPLGFTPDGMPCYIHLSVPVF